jgi:hypothetical protein
VRPTLQRYNWGDSLDMDHGTQSYNQKVDRWVYGAVTRGVTTLNSLLASLPGVYPAVVRDSLARLSKAGKLTKGNSNIANVEPNGFKSPLTVLQPLSHGITLPIPHPLDYDWRFADSTVAFLLDRCLELTAPNETIVLLGTPTIFRNALENRFPRRLILLDSNPEMVARLNRALFANAEAKLCNVLRDPLPEIEASLVIADPPWYAEHLEGFTWAATKLCKPEGHILVSIPPIGTRPGIERDRENLFEWMERLGLRKLGLEMGVLPYMSPPFEINALKAAGFHGILRQWRRGDLGIFIKEERQSSLRPAIQTRFEESWVEESIDSIRVRVRRDTDEGFNDPTIKTIVAGDILPSSSRRDKRRAQADVWTSGNRIYACDGRSVLLTILRALALGEDPYTTVERKLGRALSESERNLIGESVNQLIEVIDLEQKENQLFAENYSNG